MIKQPVHPYQENCGSKPCWVCHDVSIPYGDGFCTDCWSAVPEAVRFIYTASWLLPKNWHDVIRVAIVGEAQAERRRRLSPPIRREPLPRPEPKKKLTGLTLDDLF